MCVRCGRRHQRNFVVEADSCFRCGGTRHYAHGYPTGRPIMSITSGSGYDRGSNSTLKIRAKDISRVQGWLLAAVLRVTTQVVVIKVFVPVEVGATVQGSRLPDTLMP